MSSRDQNEPNDYVLDRRTFLKKAGKTAAGATALSSVRLRLLDGQTGDHAPAFASEWDHQPDRIWIGPEYWANPLQDWRLRDGWLECFSAGGDRNVVLLTHELSDRPEEFSTSVRIRRLDSTVLGMGYVGFRLGVRCHTNDFRARAIYGQALNIGVCGDGRPFIGEVESSTQKMDLSDEFRLRVRAQPERDEYVLTLRAETTHGKHAVEISKRVPASSLVGGVGLVCSSGTLPALPELTTPVKDFNFYPPRQRRGGTLRFSFADWQMTGSKLDIYNERAYGPIFFTLYSVSRGTLKLSAQLPPVTNSNAATLQIEDASGQWKTIAVADPDPDAHNVCFRVPEWDASRPCKYRVLYSMPRRGGIRQYSYEGTIRQDPVAKKRVVVGLLTCLWDLGFPHTDFTTNLAFHKPDILLWTGDQIYEAVGGFGVIESRQPNLLEPALHDFLRKWYIFGWSVRELTRDIPSICMTDDHDMYHGNIWGCGGRPTNPAAGEGAAAQDSGGYKMPPRWVNMVQRLQTAHLPDPYDPTRVEQGIGVYYTSLQWGGVSFAVLEDRKWKSAPKQQLPEADIYNGFAMNPAWDTTTDAGPRAELLGQRQLDFLEAWAADWSGGTWMKLAVSQTICGCLHTEPNGIRNDDKDPDETVPPVGLYLEGDHPVADHDSGAWPQSGRNAAIAKWRKGFAIHLCGDQHLGSTSHYGIEGFRDAVYSVCTPAISSIWPRRWFPPHPASNALPGSRNTGDYLDAFGNHITVLATANPAQYPGPGLEGLRLRATGYTIVSCDRSTREITVTQWPRWVDPSIPGASPYGGWPITIQQLDNGLAGAMWELPSIATPEFRDPVVQVQREETHEVVYTIRASGHTFLPRVRTPGQYRIVAYDPDGEYRMEWKNLTAIRSPLRQE